MSTDALAQRRQPDGERVDSVVEVFAEAAFANEEIERPVGGRNQPEVHVDGAVAAQSFEAAFFEHPQQLGLRDQRQIANLVQQERAAVGQLESAGLAVVGAGERALLVAEDLRLEQRVGQRGAVDRLEAFLSASGQLVNHLRDELFARAGRAENQHRDIRLGRGANPLEDGDHFLVAANHLAEALDRWRGLFDADGGAPFEEIVEQPGDRILVRAAWR